VANQHIADEAWQIVRPDDPTQAWDDGVITYTLPFVYNFYGVNYSVVHISTNGNIHFGLPNDYWPGKSNLCIPANSPYVPKALIAPLWYDFVVSSTLQGGVYTDIIGSAPNRTYVVEWRNVSTYGAPNVRATFELLLKEDGDIIYQYNSFNGSGVTGRDGVVGIQDANGSIGLPYSCYADELAPERTILYRVQQAVILTPGDSTRGGAPGASVFYTQTLLNQTGMDNSFNLSATGQSWPASVSPTSTGNIPRGGSTQVTVRVDIPPGVPLGSSDIATLNVSANLPSPGVYTDTALLTTTASTLGADFAPAGQTQAGNYGSPVTYTLSLTNRSGQTNSFDLSTDGAEWSTTIAPTTTGMIAPDASVPISVRVLVPSNASLGARDVVTVTAVGQLPTPGQFYGQTVLTTTAGIWQRKSNMPLARSRGAAVAFQPNGRIYVIGGEYNNGNTGMPIEEYNPLSDTWTERIGLQTGVSNVGAAAIGNAIYIPGGYSTADPAGTRSTLQVYYPLENRVSTITTDPLPAPRFGSGVAAYNGKLYVIGGSDDSLAAKNTVYEYDPARPAGSRWQTKAPMPTARIYLGAGELDGLIYAAGGIPGGFTDLATLEAYNPATNSWQTRTPMSIGRGGLAVVGVDSTQPGCGGYLYAIGGGWINYTARAERYNPTTNSWEPISSLSVGRRTLFAAYSPGTYSLVAMGGWDGTYDSRTESISCAGGIVLPSPTPTLPVTPVSATPTSTPGACYIQFTDVPAGSTFYPFITCLACHGVISGYPCGSPGEQCDPNSNPYFRPGNQVTRGQIAKIVSESAGFFDPVTTQTFEDIAPGSTFYTYTERLSSRGVMSGYPCGGAGEPCVPPNNRPYFRPTNNATRGQIAKIVSNAAGYNEEPTTQNFEDVPPGSTFYTFTERLATRFIMSGYTCGTIPTEPCVPPDNRPYFRPNNNATRGQTSKIVSNTFFPTCATFHTWR
jgi:N-acetylneuraminic acid mutarotase